MDVTVTPNAKRSEVVKGDDEILNEIQQLAAGGATGSIVGRNSFQRPFAQAVDLLAKIIAIYRTVAEKPDQ